MLAFAIPWVVCRPPMSAGILATDPHPNIWRVLAYLAQKRRAPTCRPDDQGPAPCDNHHSHELQQEEAVFRCWRERVPTYSNNKWASEELPPSNIYFFFLRPVIRHWLSWTACWSLFNKRRRRKSDSSSIFLRPSCTKIGCLQSWPTSQFSTARRCNPQGKR